MKKRGLSKKPFSIVLIILIIALIAIFLYFLITTLISKISQPLLSPTTTTITAMIEDGWVGETLPPPPYTYTRNTQDINGLNIGAESGQDKRSYLEFDISEIPKSAQISDAKLRIYVSKPCRTDSICRGSYIVTAIPNQVSTYTDANLYAAISGTPYASAQDCGSAGWKEISISSSAIQTQLDNEYNWFNLGLVATNYRSADESWFTSSELGDNRPQLIVTYIAPTLEVTLLEPLPPYPTLVTQNTPFNVKAKVCCYDAYCGNVNVGLYRNVTESLTSDKIKEDGELSFSPPSTYARTKNAPAINIGYYGGIQFKARAYFEFDTGSIPDNALITNILFNLYVGSVTLLTDPCYINDIVNEPLTSSDSALHGDIETGTNYNTGTWCQTTGLKNLILDSAKQDLENLLPQNWFGLGIRTTQEGDDHQTHTSQFYSSEYTNPDQRPVLNISYIALVSTTPALPLHTTSGNPQTITLAEGECIGDNENPITWEVYPTGLAGSIHNLLAYAEMQDDSEVNDGKDFEVEITSGPQLTINLLEPADISQPVIETQNTPFNVQADVCCSIENCGDVDVNLLYGGNTMTSIVESTNLVGQYSSIALDSNGVSHISEYDSINKDLRYCNNAAGSWSCIPIDSANDVGTYSSIAIDSNNKVHISEYDATNGDLKYCTNAGGSWSPCTIVDTANDIGTYSSIAIDSNNKVHISEYDSTSSDLKYCTNAAGSWSCNPIDTAGIVGLFSSIAIDSNNKVHISEYENVNGDLKYCTNAAGSWSPCTIVDSANIVGQYSSIAIDSNNKVYISELDNTNHDLRYCTNAAGSFICTIVDSANIVGQYSSIAIDSNDKVHIAEYDSTNNDIKHCDNTASDGSWSCVKLEDTGVAFGRNNGDRWLAIKKGRLVDPTSFDTSAHMSWFNYAGGDLMHTAYQFAGTPSEKGLVPTTYNFPFYIISSNPTDITPSPANPNRINLVKDQCKSVTFSVNPIGSTGLTYTFLSQAKMVSNPLMLANTPEWEVQIQAQSPGSQIKNLNIKDVGGINNLVVTPQAGSTSNVIISATVADSACNADPFLTSTTAYICDTLDYATCAPTIDDSTYQINLEFQSKVGGECTYSYTGNQNTPQFWKLPGTWKLYVKANTLTNSIDFEYQPLSEIGYAGEIDFGRLTKSAWNQGKPSTGVELFNKGNVPLTIKWQVSPFSCLAPCTSSWTPNSGITDLQLDDDSVHQETTETGLNPIPLSATLIQFPPTLLPVCTSDLCSAPGEKIITYYHLMPPDLQPGDYANQITISLS